MSAADEAGGQAPDAGTQAAAGQALPMSQEFYLRVNDFIQMANRIERRYDTHHGQLAFMHAFARYSAHHYRTTASVDDEENRQAFAQYIGASVRQLVLGHLKDMVGEPQPATDAPAAGDAAATPEA